MARQASIETIIVDPSARPRHGDDESPDGATDVLMQAREPRTAHMIANVEIQHNNGITVDVRYNWHTLSHRFQTTMQYFGTTFCATKLSGPAPVILRKKVDLKNDYIHQLRDIYHG